MITEKDLVGSWNIIETVLSNPTVESQEEIDRLNSKYVINYKSNGRYSENNVALIMSRLSNLNGSYSLDGNVLTMTIKSLSFNRTYVLESINPENTEIKFYPRDTLYCSIYSNIEYIILKKI